MIEVVVAVVAAAGRRLSRNSCLQKQNLWLCALAAELTKYSPLKQHVLLTARYVTKDTCLPEFTCQYSDASAHMTKTHAFYAAGRIWDSETRKQSVRCSTASSIFAKRTHGSPAFPKAMFAMRSRLLSAPLLKLLVV